MLKRFKIYIIVFFSLLTAVVIMTLTSRSSTFKLSSAGFAVSDIRRISEIEIKQGEKKVVLVKSQGTWLINNEHQAEKQLMSNFLRALGSLRVKSPVPAVEMNIIMGLLKEEGIEVTIKKRWRSKTFRVLYEDSGPTYMLLGNSKSPFLVEVPGLVGETGTLFSPEEGFWRENVIFAYSPEQVSSIKVNYNNGLGNGFEILIHEDNRFELFSLPQKFPLEHFSDSIVFRYITYYSFVPYTRLLTTDFPLKLDSLRNADSFATLSVTDIRGHTESVKLHFIESKAKEGEFDPNVLYGLINDDRELVLLTFVNVDLLLKEADFFIRR